MDNKDSYNKICEKWHEFRQHTEINPCIVSFVENLPSRSKVLDIGCGTGYPIDAYLTSCGFQVTGIDISEEMIEKAKAMNLSGAVFLVKDLLHFLPSEKYDAVIAFDSLWHIAYDRQTEIYGMISSFMNVGGYFFFTHGKHDGQVVGTMFGEKFYYSALDKKTVHALLIQNGFSVISSVEDYEDLITGDRELMIVARKEKSYVI